MNRKEQNQAGKLVEEVQLKDCACQGLGPCQCSTTEEKKEEEAPNPFKDMKYVYEMCGCNGNCGC